MRLSPYVIELDDFLSHLEATGVSATPIQVEVELQVLHSSFHQFGLAADASLFNENRPQNRNLQP